ncbi:site-specific integrase [Mycolicibacterium fluoranthenivorans]|uniref:Site-specific integrase n=1 Tax=Mycolicibacterium fluoranthenivorans TaxID=258505 RepID=A0A7G8P9I0_9MYCO|nr:site-specific integrase [Mycolicibacterium fluoranthenivorans]QNJ90996.1 site-specific integrase [Mycolicibacterium fluoranthenivorans]
MDGEGTVPKLRKDGRWEARIRFTDRFGKPGRKSVYGRTFDECRANADEVKQRVANDLPASDARDSISDWSRHWRETTLEASSYKTQTKSQYAQLAKVHIEQSSQLANLKLKNLKASHVEGWLVELRKKAPANARDKSRVLSDSTIRTCYTVLRAQMDTAVRDGMLARNPVAAIRRPKVKNTDSVAKIDPETIARVIELTSVSRYHHAVVLTSLLGTRIGETLGLRWRDIDEQGRQISIVKTTAGQGKGIGLENVKSARSRRTIPLTGEVLQVLKAQRKVLVASQLRAGDRWSKEGDGLIFRTELGTIVDDRYLLRAMASAARRAGVADRVTNHTLRHTAAQTWLEAGVHIKAVSDLLGHSSIAITGDIYGHTSDDTARAAMDVLAARLGHRRPDLKIVEGVDAGATNTTQG